MLLVRRAHRKAKAQSPNNHLLISLPNNLTRVKATSNRNKSPMSYTDPHKKKKKPNHLQTIKKNNTEIKRANHLPIARVLCWVGSLGALEARFAAARSRLPRKSAVATALAATMRVARYDASVVLEIAPGRAWLADGAALFSNL